MGQGWQSLPQLVRAVHGTQAGALLPPPRVVPAGHVTRQLLDAERTLPAQVTVPPATAVQARQSEPQAASVSQRLQAPLLPQIEPGPHKAAVQPQWPASQGEPPGQARPQPPQFRGSLAGETQPPSHESCPDPQTSSHRPALQPVPRGQATPQPPQFDGSVCGATQPPSQASSPVAQVEPQLAWLQSAPWPHALSHAPQFAGSLERSAQPLPQTVRPEGQTKAQPPPTQAGVAPTGAGQSMPQPPQLSGSVWKSTQRPRQLDCPPAQLPPSVGASDGPGHAASKAAAATDRKARSPAARMKRS